MNIEFINVHDQKIREAFTKVVHHYDQLDGLRVILKQGRIKSSTMQAQPIIRLSSFFTGIHTYKIKLAVHVRDSNNLKVSELPKEVLVGWFAHELGHVIDYLNYTWFGMIWYGIRYIFSESFKRQCEHTADRIAVEHGFMKEIILTKEFILNHELLEERYKNKIRKYYMSLEDVRMCVTDKTQPLPDTSI